MTKGLLVAIGMLAFSAPAHAERPITPEEEDAIRDAISAQGCAGGTYEFDRDAAKYVVRNALCENGKRYTFDLDPSFDIIDVNHEA